MNNFIKTISTNIEMVEKKEENVFKMLAPLGNKISFYITYYIEIKSNIPCQNE